MRAIIRWVGTVAYLGKPTSDKRILPMREYAVREAAPVLLMGGDVAGLISDAWRDGDELQADLVLYVDQLSTPESLYPQADFAGWGDAVTELTNGHQLVDVRTLVGLHLGTMPAWPDLDPVIEVRP